MEVHNRVDVCVIIYSAYFGHAPLSDILWRGSNFNVMMRFISDKYYLKVCPRPLLPPHPPYP